MPAITQEREAQKKIISEYLKAADRYIKSSEFPKALDEVKKALGVEPNNMYAMAYNERIKVAMEAARKKEEEEHLKKQAEEQKKSPLAMPKPAETAPRAANAPDAKPQSAPAQLSLPTPAVQLPGDDMIAKIKKEATEAAEKKTDARIELLKQEFTASQQKFQEDIVRLTSQAKEALAKKEEAEKKLALLQSQLGNENASIPGGTSRGSSDRPSGKLFQKAWDDGVISPDERGLLDRCEERRGIVGPGFCKSRELRAASSSYMAHLREVWRDGLVTPEEAETLEALRKSLNISAEEHFKLEGQVRKEMQAKK